jgi:Cu+-exporting ATPase
MKEEQYPAVDGIKKGKKKQVLCYHCGDECSSDIIVHEEKNFCCNGCSTVFEILNASGMCDYYNMDENPGFSLKGRAQAQFSWLDDPEVIGRLVDYADDTITKVTFHLPQIHCVACVWLLENLYKFNTGISVSRVNFPRRELFVNFQTGATTLRKVVELLDSIGYTPAINMANLGDKTHKVADKSLYYKLGFLLFAFGNVMLFTFPQYLGLVREADESFFTFFSYLNLIISIPVLFYGGSDYLRSAWLGIWKGKLNLDVPLSLGMLAMFFWSVYETVSGLGHGYYDSLAGLIFFLLCGKWFQQKTFHSIEFERDYRSYFPIAVTVKDSGAEKTVVVDKIKPGDNLIIRNNELIPADGILLKGEAQIDYSFVTGESVPTKKIPGDKIYAGGKQIGGSIEITVTKRVSQSYLTQLWNDSAFEKNTKKYISELADKIGTRFTYAILAISFSTLIYWWQSDPKIAVFAFAAVLIIACPCAIALSIPFTFGNGLRILGRNDFFVKNASVFESMQIIDRVVFDKTGTLTYSLRNEIEFEGDNLDNEQLQMIRSLSSNSQHPLSRQICDFIGGDTMEVRDVIETPGQGVLGVVNGKTIKLGSENYIKGTSSHKGTAVFVSIDDKYAGFFRISNIYRKGLKDLVAYFSKKYRISLISGDSDSEKEKLRTIFPDDTDMYFNQQPHDKLNYINQCRENGERIMFFGDGLNDAGALQASDVGIVITENINNFTPASDAIVSAAKFGQLHNLISFISSSRFLVYAAYSLSLLYNIIGLSFAVAAKLSPVIAAIIMPISSITIVLFGIMSSTWLAKRKKLV